MPRQDAGAAVSVERFFQFSLLGLVASGYLAVAGSGYLDTPTIALTTAGLVLRAVLICGLVQLRSLRPAHHHRYRRLCRLLRRRLFPAVARFSCRHGAPALLPGRNENPDRQKQSRLPVYGRHRLSGTAGGGDPVRQFQLLPLPGAVPVVRHCGAHLRRNPPVHRPLHRHRAQRFEELPPAPRPAFRAGHSRHPHLDGRPVLHPAAHRRGRIFAADCASRHPSRLFQSGEPGGYRRDQNQFAAGDAHPHLERAGRRSDEMARRNIKRFRRQTLDQSRP